MDNNNAGQGEGAVLTWRVTLGEAANSPSHRQQSQVLPPSVGLPHRHHNQFVASPALAVLQKSFNRRWHAP